MYHKQLFDSYSLLQIFNFYVDWKFKMTTTAGKKWYKNILLEIYLILFLSICSLVWNVLLTNIGWYSNKTFCQFEFQDGHHQDKCYIAYIFSSPGKRPGELLPSLGGRHPSVVRRKLSHLNLLLWNHWTKLNLTWQGWSLGGSLSKLCPTAPPSI